MDPGLETVRVVEVAFEELDVNGSMGTAELLGQVKAGGVVTYKVGDDKGPTV